tara:strand:- start:30 stop:164 length:135 start_codon:yes stop_codon:yes gene_type:complete
MPILHTDEQVNFMEVLKDKLEDETHLKVVGLTVDLVDWQGIQSI